MRVGIARMPALERLADAPVQAHALRAAELLVQRLTDQRVRECKASGRAGYVDQNPTPAGFVEGVEQRVTRQPRSRFELWELELASDHRSCTQCLVRGFGQPREPPT